MKDRKKISEVEEEWGTAEEMGQKAVLEKSRG